VLFRTIFSAAAAGIVAGGVLFALQCRTTLPLIHQAERDAGAEMSSHSASPSDEPPKGGFLRTAYTSLGDILVAVGFAMLLAAMYALTDKAGIRAGLAWGLAGFATFHLGPAIVAPPALPALNLAPLSLRQAAWLVAAVSTGLGLAILTFGRSAQKLGGALLLFLPSVLFHYWFRLSNWRAPAQVLSKLEQVFVVFTLANSLVFWLVLGAISGWLFEKSSPRQNVIDV